MTLKRTAVDLRTIVWNASNQILFVSFGANAVRMIEFIENADVSRHINSIYFTCSLLSLFVVHACACGFHSLTENDRMWDVTMSVTEK